METNASIANGQWAKLARLLGKTGADRAVFYAVMGNIASLVIGPVTLLIIAARLTSELQGYYYTFGSLTTLQVIIELGLGQAIIPFASHEWSHLGFQPGFIIVGEEAARSRLISLGRLAIKWYSLAAAATSLGLAVFGLIFFSRSPSAGVYWILPWLALCLGLGASLCIMPFFYLLQGCHEIAPFWRYRLIQQVVNGLALWGALWLGARLWAQPIAGACGLLWSAIFLRPYVRFIKTFFTRPGTTTISWRSEVWPIQWRIAITWISTYFTSQIFTPVLFLYAGPIAAGKMGMTVTLVNVLVAMSSNWVVTKAPHFGGLVARRKWSELDRSYFRSLYMSVLVATLLAFCAWGSIWILNIMHSPLALRLLPPLPAAVLLVAGIISSLLGSLAVYLRAHKQEPLMPIFFAGSLAIAAIILLVINEFGSVGVAIGYLAVLLCFELPASVLLFQRLRKKWHFQVGLQEN